MLGVLLTCATWNTARAADDPNNVTAVETVQALADVPGILAASDNLKAVSDVDSASVSKAAGTTVDIPKQVDDGITVSGSDGSTLDVTPSLAQSSGAGRSVAPGVVAYPSADGASTAAQATEDGAVRFLTVIDSVDAPETFPFAVSVPSGGSVATTPEGGATVLAADGTVVATVDTPWAKDANGTKVSTWFSTDGRSLTQHVAHRVEGVVYPVTADPVLAIVGAAVTAMAVGCATNAAANLVWAGGKWALLGGDWYWRARMNQAVEDCLQGAIFGPMGRFIPGWLKAAAVNSLRPVLVQTFLYVIRVR